MMSKDKSRKKTINKDKCFNCQKMRYFEKDYIISNIQLSKKKIEQAPNYY